MTKQEIDIKIVCSEAKSKAFEIQGFEQLAKEWQKDADRWKELKKVMFRR